MQGIYVKTAYGWVRPRSKKQVREVASANPENVEIEGTSIFGDEYSGPLSDWPGGRPITFVGPDPHTKRNFYGTIDKLTPTAKVPSGFKVS